MTMDRAMEQPRLSENKTPQFPKLDGRLQAAADFVRPGSRVADIGCDHGYLAVYLAAHGAESVTASDINSGPLQRARETVERYHMEDKVTLLLSNGLEAFSSAQADDIVIAGMGGELIGEILEACPWVRDEKKHLILQPMTRAEHLRRYLYQSGFAILEETPVIDGKHHYCVIHAVYTGRERTLSDLEALTGKMGESKSPEAAAYLFHVAQREKKLGICRGEENLLRLSSRIEALAQAVAYGTKEKGEFI